MPYVTQAQVTTRLGTSALVELTSDSGDSVDTDVLDQMIQRADDQINNTLSSRYLVPVDTSADASLAATLAAMALDLVDYYLYQRRGLVDGAKEKLLENVMKWLTDVKEGLLPLPATGSVVSTVSDPPALDIGSATRQASRETFAQL